MKVHQTKNGILADTAEENTKAKRCKPNVQVAEESDDEEDEEEGEYEVLSEGAASDEEEEDIDADE